MGPAGQPDFWNYDPRTGAKISDSSPGVSPTELPELWSADGWTEPGPRRTAPLDSGDRPGEDRGGAVELVGRQWEIARADRFLADPAGRPRRARPGGRARNRQGGPPSGAQSWTPRSARSYRVLRCRTSESESALSFLGLGDLLETMSDATFEALPEPQQRSLQLALLRSSAEGSPDRVAVARGTLSLLRAAASRHRRSWRSTTPSGSTLRRRTCSASPRTG